MSEQSQINYDNIIKQLNKYTKKSGNINIISIGDLNKLIFGEIPDIDIKIILEYKFIEYYNKILVENSKKFPYVDITHLWKMYNLIYMDVDAYYGLYERNIGHTHNHWDEYYNTLKVDTIFRVLEVKKNDTKKSIYVDIRPAEIYNGNLFRLGKRSDKITK